MKKICQFITRYMALLVLAAAIASFLWPSVTGVVKTSWITPLLGCVMFGMGLSLDTKDFVKVFSSPKDLFAGFLCQFLIMPFSALALVKLFHLPADLAVGVILVGCCPGGTSSNVITYLSKGDVAFSVGMTSVSTILAPLMTPMLVKLLAGALIPVDFVGMFLSIIEVIIVPIAAGILVKSLLPSVSEKLVSFLPAFSTLAITVIVVAVVSANAAMLHKCGALVILVVILHNLCGYSLGYAASRLFKMDKKKSIAVSIEVGMQNSGLACSLASLHFASMALAGVPGAVFSVWHNISGALLARFLGRRKNA